MSFTLTDLWHHMGLFARIIVGVLGVMSVASLLVMVERVILYRRSNRASLAFAEAMAPLLASGDVDAAAEKQPSGDVGHLGRVIGAGLKAYSTSPKEDRELAVDSVARALERQSQREVALLRRGQGMLATIGSTSPFVGLLGTVVGIVNSFQMMAASGSAGLGTVSAGIAEALVTTAFGLLVAVPAVMAFNFLQGWVDARAVDISESSNELVDLVARRLRVLSVSQAAE
jgi:biopolymer transport protein ExbB/biopolymer transport protein TolQ